MVISYFGKQQPQNDRTLDNIDDIDYVRNVDVERSLISLYVNEEF